jgi:hypothetical protein
VNDLESANIRTKELIALSLGEYVVFDQRIHNVIPGDPSISGWTPEGSDD